MRLLWLPLALIVALNVVCASPPAVTPVSSSLTTCNSARVRELVEQLFRAWTAHDVEAVALLFAGSFALEDRIHERMTVIQDASRLREYLRGRFALGEKFSELSADIPTRPSPTGSNATVQFRRSFDNERLQGTGKLVCGEGRLTYVLLGAQ